MIVPSHLHPGLIGVKILTFFFFSSSCLPPLRFWLFRLWASYQKIHKLSNVLAYFSTRNWSIPNNNLQRVWSNLSEKERKIFNYDLDNLDWKRYFRNHVFGIRLYIIKDKEETIPFALRKRKK